jgi:hypothetical protein
MSDDEPVFVPQQAGLEDDPPTMKDLNLLRDQNNYIEQEIERALKVNERMTAILNQKQRRTQSLQTQVNLIKGADQGYLLYIEQFRGRRQPVWWYVALLFSVICVFGTWDKSAWVSFLANVCAHKLLWRRLYVETNTTPQWIAVCIIVYTIIFVR